MSLSSSAIANKPADASLASGVGHSPLTDGELYCAVVRNELTLANAAIGNLPIPSAVPEVNSVKEGCLPGLFNKLCQLIKFVMLSEADIGSAGEHPMKE